MNKLFINLLLILGINFSLLQSLNGSSERQLIYEKENRVGEALKGSPSKFKEVQKEADGLFQGKSSAEVDNLLYFDTRRFNNPSLPVSSEETASHQILMIVHTKYNLDPHDPYYDAKLAEAAAYMARIEQYDRLSPNQRYKEIEENLKRVPHDRSEVSTNMDPNSSTLQDQP